MIFIPESEVQRVLTADKAIAALQSAFRTDVAHTVRMPTRSQHDLSPDHVLLTMPCYSSEIGRYGVKLVTVSKNGVSATHVDAIYLLYDRRTSAIDAMIEASYLTDLRTAAASALVTKFLAAPDAKVLGLFGTGRQARIHAELLPTVRRFERILVCGSSREKAKAFADSISAGIGSEAQAVHAEECVRGSDVIATCTNSMQPLFDGRWLRPGTHLNLVGGYRPDMREVDDATIMRSRVIVDTRDGVLAEAGELIIPLRSGAIDPDHILGDLHQLVGGDVTVRSSPQDITLFKSVGCALEDLAVANLVYELTQHSRA